MMFDWACVCFYENVVTRPAISLDGPDLTDFGLILSLVSIVRASGESLLMC